VLVFEQRNFLRVHNAVNSGRTCIYFEKLFKNDVLTPTADKVSLKKLEGKHQQKVLLRKCLENERTLRKVARKIVKRVDKCTEMNGHHFQHLL
jgi:hypothetical protein